ncbi:type III secretion system chaperone [Hydrogenophaga sp.]|uniref:type III secretion system chaperone n=1 Tax=Hydrogenophaga sp. TaxID=1904254 RepID=UPI0025BA744A|nr:type III secretion system chaperone [Hydrogenophaga sp.]
MPSPVQTVLEELGPLSDDVSTVALHDDNAWVVTYADDTQVVLTWCEEPPRLQTLTQVAQLDQALTNEHMEALLTFNLLSSQSQGARMAWSPQERSLYILRDLPEVQCDLTTLRDSLRSLLGTADYWREALMDDLNNAPRENNLTTGASQ